MQCERMRAMSKQSQILLLGTNRPITTCQGNTMVTLLRRYDGNVWVETIFYVYCATMGGSNFLAPIPACAGMTRTVYLFLFYEHCSGLCYLLFFKSSYRRRSVSIAPQGLIIPLPRPPGASTPSPAKGNFIPRR